MFNKKGFSLAELLIVMFIISTLGVVGMRVMWDQRVTAKDTARKQTLQNIQWALEDYNNKNWFYPQPAVRYIDMDQQNNEWWMEWVKNIWWFVPPNDSATTIAETLWDWEDEQDTLFLDETLLSQYSEAIPSCKIKYEIWDEWENRFPFDESNYETFLNDFHCWGIIRDRSWRSIIWWKWTLTEFSWKNSSSVPSAIYKGEEIDDDSWKKKSYINPITNRDQIIAKFDENYFKWEILLEENRKKTRSKGETIYICIVISLPLEL